MQISPSYFVPTEEIRKIASGSYEHLISRLDVALTAQQRAKMFGEEVSAKILGTFPGHAVVLSETGKCVRVKFEESKQGAIKIVAFEALPVPSYSSDNLGDYIKKEALRIVDAFLKGGLTEAEERLRRLAPLVDSLSSDHDDAKMTEGVVLSLRAPRPWKQMYAERGPSFRQFLGEAAERLDAERLSTKFVKLYDGSTKEEELEGFRDLVNEDLQFVGKRVTDLLKVVEDAQRALAAFSAQTPSVEEEARVLTTLASFAQDLVGDLRLLQKVALESSKQVARVDCLGRLYDALAEELHQYEVAGSFIIAMTTRLSEAEKK